MRLWRLQQRHAAWLILWVAGLVALAPTLSRALAWASSSGWVELCTPAGVRWVRVAAGEAAGAPAVPGQPPLTDHCPLCALLGDRLGPPPTPWAPPALAQRHAPPAAARPGSPAPRWAIAAPPRGPPPPLTPVTA